VTDSNLYRARGTETDSNLQISSERDSNIHKTRLTVISTW